MPSNSSRAEQQLANLSNARPPMPRAPRTTAPRSHGARATSPLHASVFMVVQRFRSDLGLFVHLHALVTDGAFEEEGGAQRFLPASTPTAERMMAVLAQVHKVLAAVHSASQPWAAPSSRGRGRARRPAVRGRPAQQALVDASSTGWTSGTVLRLRPKS